MTSRLAFILIALALAAVACGSSSDGSSGLPDQLADAIGDLSKASSYQYSATGVRYEPGQGPELGEVVEASTFGLDVATDLATGDLRLTWVRAFGEQTVFPGFEVAYTEVVNAEAGYIDGDDAVLGIGPSRPMNSSRIAAVQRQQLLLQPHLAVALALAADQPIRELDDNTVEVGHERGPLLFTFDDSTGDLVEVVTTESDPLTGDIEVRIELDDWRTVDGLRIAADVVLLVDGIVVHQESRSGFEVNPTLDPDAFTPIETAPLDEALFEQGWNNSQWFNRALALPFGSGFADQTLNAPAEIVRLSDEVVVIAGTRHNAVLVDMGESVAFIEPSINADRSRQILDIAAEEFGGKPVSHVVLTHDHHDQIGGVREAVSDGAEAVLAAGDEAFFQSVFDGVRTVEPDSLTDGSSVPIIPVGDDPIVIGDGAITVHRFSSIHDAEMLLVCIPEAGLAFNSDLYNPGGFPPDVVLPEPQLTFASEILTAIETRCPETTGLLGSHGAPTPAPIEVVAVNAGRNTP